ncbi:putative 54S ribosomal protein L22, mitochondrial [Amylocarpus encephaloides]|uniref:54S ribosomal protein L22, mitochondrial n=1 Tax=Amylocarpus encephaloides TaxID=45428 RepID=A0A9P8CA95_9HELO|nr:putative 54S ribosomal protein L22, mitochondrial [Amylocarpus encephaloides]
MSLNLPIRRAAGSASALTSSQPSFSHLVPRCQQRTIFGFGKLWGDSSPPKKLPTNAIASDFLKKKATQPQYVPGDLGQRSIFNDEEAGGTKPRKREDTPFDALALEQHYRKPVLDPNPETREKWERKMVVRMIKKRGHLSRKQLLKQQERELLAKSHYFKTSVKKLVPLAKQITGKTVEEAIVQMRFSVKKAAKEVKEHLEHAKNEAIVSRGMALGKFNSEDPAKPIWIQTKDGKALKVDDPTKLYIQQAWVGRGGYKTSLDIRARGRAYIMKHPTTAITVVLKEEKTRIREHEERQEKLRNRKTWVHLPNRPITAQRQYYSW